MIDVFIGIELETIFLRFYFANWANCSKFAAQSQYAESGFSMFLTAKLRKMIETLLLTVLIIAIAAILLGVKVIFRKNGSFSSMHIHDSQAMQERGIHCVFDQDREQRQKKQWVKESRNKTD